MPFSFRILGALAEYWARWLKQPIGRRCGLVRSQLYPQPQTRHISIGKLPAFWAPMDNLMRWRPVQASTQSFVALLGNCEQLKLWSTAESGASMNPSLQAELGQMWIEKASLQCNLESMFGMLTIIHNYHQLSQSKELVLYSEAHRRSFGNCPIEHLMHGEMGPSSAMRISEY